MAYEIYKTIQEWVDPQTGDTESLMRGIDHPEKLCLNIHREFITNYILYSMDTGAMSYWEYDREDPAVRIKLEKKEMENIFGVARVDYAECMLENIAFGVMMEKDRHEEMAKEQTTQTPTTEVQQTSQPLSEVPQEQQVVTINQAIAELADPKRMENIADKLWQDDWPQQDKSEWHAPSLPNQDGPAPTTQQLLEQNDDSWRFFEQQQAEGDRARLFGFNAKTGESLTWEWDADKQQPLIEDPQNALPALQQHNYWSELEAMINQKAAALAEAPEHEKRAANGFVDRLGKKDKDAAQYGL